MGYLILLCGIVAVAWLYRSRMLSVYKSIIDHSQKTNDLLLSLNKYKTAYNSAQKCPETILSSGRTEESIRLMKDLETAREELFKFCDPNFNIIKEEIIDTTNKYEKYRNMKLTKKQENILVKDLEKIGVPLYVIEKIKSRKYKISVILTSAQKIKNILKTTWKEIKWNKKFNEIILTFEHKDGCLEQVLICLELE